MRRRLAVLLALVPLAVTGASSSATTSSHTTAADRPLYGLLSSAHEREFVLLARLHPRTLAATGRRLRLPRMAVPAGRSPDGRFAAFYDRQPARVHVVDLHTMRVRGVLPLGTGKRWRVREAAWLTADRVVFVVQRLRGSYEQIVDTRQIVVVDPHARRVVARRPFANAMAVHAAAPGGDKLVLLLGRGDRSGRALQLAVVETTGVVRSVALRLDSPPPTLEHLLVAPSGTRAFVVAAGSPILDVDLESLQVSRRSVSGAPALFTTAADFASRGGVWIDDRTIAVFGRDHAVVRSGVDTTRPAGLALVDTRTWQARMIDAEATGATFAAGTLLAYGVRTEQVRVRGRRTQRAVGIGLRAFSLTGARRWQRFAGQPVTATAVRDIALVYRIALPATRIAARSRTNGTFPIDVSTGRRTGPVRPLEKHMWLLPEPSATSAARALAATPSAKRALELAGDGEAFTGIARSDVTRAVAIFVDGRQSELPLVDGRVEYRAESPERAARAVHAYVGNQLVASVRLPVRCGGSAGPCAATAETGAAEPVYAFVGELPAARTSLVRVDPRTLRRLPGGITFEESFSPSYARSPDGGRLALAAHSGPIPRIAGGPVLRIVDLDRLKPTGLVRLGGGSRSSARVVAWLSARRVVAVVQRLSQTGRYVRERTLVFADPTTGRVVARRRLTNKLAVAGAIGTGGRLVLMLQNSSHRGSTVQLVVAEADGAVRTRAIEVGKTRGVLNAAALAVEPSGERAFLVQTAVERDTPPVIEVELATLRVQSRRVDVDGTTPRPPALLFTLPGRVIAVDERRIVATGAVAATERREGRHVPAAGVFVIDTRAWSARILDSRAVYFQPSGRIVLTYGLSARETELRRRTGRGAGVSAYELTGRRLYHLYGNRVFSEVEVAGDFGHVLLGRPRSKRLVFDAREGKPLGMLPAIRRPIDLLEPPPAPPPTRSLTGRGQSEQAYTFSSRGRRVALRGRPRFFHERQAVAFLLGTLNGRAFYRVQPEGTTVVCFGLGAAHKLGEVGSLGCAPRFGAQPLSTFMMGGGPRGATPGFTRIDGFAADQVARVVAVDADGKELAGVTPANNIFSFPTPLPPGIRDVVALDAEGRRLPPRPGRPQPFPPFLFGPRSGKVPPSALREPIRRAENRGVVVTLGRNGVAVFDLTRATPFVRRLASGRRVGFACFRLSSPRKATYAFVHTEYHRRVAIRIRGIPMPLDGCEIQGSYGHKWRDARGTHSLVEAAFTTRAARYFEDRATARDLALFVRSRDMHAIRRATGEVLRRRLRERYGQRIVELPTRTASPPARTVGYWIGGSETLFVERSATGARFYVRLVGGRIRAQNLRPLAFVF